MTPKQFMSTIKKEGACKPATDMVSKYFYAHPKATVSDMFLHAAKKHGGVKYPGWIHRWMRWAWRVMLDWKGIGYGSQKYHQFMRKEFGVNVSTKVVTKDLAEALARAFKA